jgi:hypothetical protein
MQLFHRVNVDIINLLCSRVEQVNICRVMPCFFEANWYGVRFLDLSPDAEKSLEAFIDTHAAKSPPRPGER